MGMFKGALFVYRVGEGMTTKRNGLPQIFTERITESHNDVKMYPHLQTAPKILLELVRKSEAHLIRMIMKEEF